LTCEDATLGDGFREWALVPDAGPGCIDPTNACAVVSAATQAALAVCLDGGSLVSGLCPALSSSAPSDVAACLGGLTTPGAPIDAGALVCGAVAQVNALDLSSAVDRALQQPGQLGQSGVVGQDAVAIASNPCEVVARLQQGGVDITARVNQLLASGPVSLPVDGGSIVSTLCNPILQYPELVSYCQNQTLVALYATGCCQAGPPDATDAGAVDGGLDGGTGADGGPPDGGQAMSCDVDGDGYPAPACVTDGGIADCDDLNAYAHPTQTAFFTVPRANNTFDYDCDGFETHAFPVVDCLSARTVTECEGAGFAIADPGCGRTGALVTCKWALTSCLPADAGLATQECR
jgi:hypothetical protein